MDEPRPEAVLPRLRGRLGRDFRYVPACSSTQRLLESGREGAVAATDHQTEGRGRLGRRWVAPPSTSLLFSVVLEPPVPPQRLPELTPLAAEAVADAIRSLAPPPVSVGVSVKAPNDVLVGGRKVAGILGEAARGRVVLGIGVNVHQPADELPERAAYPATSLALEGAAVDRVELLVVILDRLEQRYDAWLA